MRSRTRIGTDSRDRVASARSSEAVSGGWPNATRKRLTIAGSDASFAIIDFTVADLKDKPKNVEGLIFKEQGLKAAAIPELQKAIELRPDMVEPRVHLANYLLESGNATEAAGLLETALRRLGVLARLPPGVKVEAEIFDLVLDIGPLRVGDGEGSFERLCHYGAFPGPS